MAKYPQYEIKVIYKCQLCEDNHVSIARATGGALTAELAGGAALKGQSLTKRCMEIARKGVIKDFFKAHPKAGLDDFKLDASIAEETVIHGENPEDVNKDKLGVSMTKEEVKEVVEEMGREAKIKEETVFLAKSPSVEEAKRAGGEKGMDFDHVTAGVKKRLEELEEREKQLSAELLLVQLEKKQFKGLWEAALKVQTDKKMEDLKEE